MKHFLTLILALFIVSAFAQNNDQNESSDNEKTSTERFKEDSDIRTLSQNGHNGGFFGLTFKTGQFNKETIVSMGFRTGWIVSRTMGIGFEAHGLVPTAKFSNISPNADVVTLGGYGGMFLEPILFSNQAFHVTFPIAGGGGWFGYLEDWENSANSGSLIDQDTYWYFEPGIALEINVSKNFRLAFGGSQRYTQEMELMNTPTSAFNGRSYYMTMKFGKF